MPGDRALVLLPCSGTKRVRPTALSPAEPVAGIEAVRDHVWSALGSGPEPGKTVPAIALYDGLMYVAADRALRAVATGKYPSVDVLIVSALYGLVRPAEPIADYDLTMGTTTDHGSRVYRLWQQHGIADVLARYVRDREITRVWSLLSSSVPASPYQQAFQAFWETTRVPSRHVRVRNAGMDILRKRGAWLDVTLRVMPEHLLEDRPDPERIRPYLDCAVQYDRCRT